MSTPKEGQGQSELASSSYESCIFRAGRLGARSAQPAAIQRPRAAPISKGIERSPQQRRQHPPLQARRAPHQHGVERTDRFGCPHLGARRRNPGGRGARRARKRSAFERRGQILVRSLAQDELRTLLLNDSPLNHTMSPSLRTLRPAHSRYPLENLRAFLARQPQNLVTPR